MISARQLELQAIKRLQGKASATDNPPNFTCVLLTGIVGALLADLIQPGFAANQIVGRDSNIGFDRYLEVRLNIRIQWTRNCLSEPVPKIIV